MKTIEPGQLISCISSTCGADPDYKYDPPHVLPNIYLVVHSERVLPPSRCAATQRHKIIVIPLGNPSGPKTLTVYPHNWQEVR